MPRTPRIQLRQTGKRRRPFYTITTGGKRSYLGTDPAVAHQRASEILGHDPAPARTPLTVSEVVEGWLTEHIDFRNPEWLKAWALFERRPITDLGTACLTRYDKHLSRRGLAIKTRIHYVAAAFRVCQWATERGWLSEVPDKPKQPKPPINPTDIPLIVVREALASMPSHTARLVRFVLGTGCRVSEACRLRWNHYDADRERFVFPPSEHKTGPATGRPRRIFLTPDAQAVIDELGVKQTGFVFLTRRGAPYTLSGLRATLRRHGIDSPRKLRHTAAQWWLDHGVSLEDVAKLLGHRSLRMVQVYAEIRDARASALAATLTSPGQPDAAPPTHQPKVRALSSAKPRRSKSRTSAGTRSSPKPKRATRKASRSRRSA